ncbi:MAG: hypothetical protein M1383_01700 [Patescibacteria group bacterium]|nr:hypothetical protein [Patescibacteria group bacterium]
MREGGGRIKQGVRTYLWHKNFQPFHFGFPNENFRLNIFAYVRDTKPLDSAVVQVAAVYPIAVCSDWANLAEAGYLGVGQSLRLGVVSRKREESEEQREKQKSFFKVFHSFLFFPFL